MPRRTGKKALMEMLHAEGVGYIFVNSDTSEWLTFVADEGNPNLREGAGLGDIELAVPYFALKMKKGRPCDRPFAVS